VSFFRARRLPAVAVVLAAAVFGVPGAAHAGPADQIQLEAPDILVPTGSTASGVAVRLRNSGDADVALTNVKVVIDASGLAGVATVADARPTFGGDCDTAGLRTTCTYEQLNVSIIGEYPAFLDLKAAAGAAAGATGSYAVTAEADGFSRTASGQVTVAEAVNLVAGPEITLAGAAGSTLALSPTVRNAGSQVVRGAVLASSSGSRSASYRPQYSNCVYTDVEFFCVFDEELAAGRQYAPASPVAVRLGGDAPAPSTFETYADWQTPADAADSMRAIRNRGGRPGTGPVLRLVEKAAPALRAAPQSDVSALDNYTHVVVNVTGKNLPDLAAVDTTVSGAVGETVTAKIAIKNLGPAVIDAWDQFPSAYVVLPAGTTVVEADRNCVPVEGRAGEYRCLSGGLTVGETAGWALKITISGTGKGTITARTEVAGEDGFGPDRNAANNTAEFLITAATGGGTGGGTDGGGEGGGDGGGEGGGLPVTGTNATLAVGAGIALLLAGGAVVVVTRRRRTRYVA
jgi:LPXTG-motif cell wall-anchored protein